MGGFYVADYSKLKKEGIAQSKRKADTQLFFYVPLPHFHSWGITFLHSHPFSQRPRIWMLSPYPVLFKAKPKPHNPENSL